jgi:N-acyl-D-aspartate/D-glutamate deacylase
MSSKEKKENLLLKDVKAKIIADTPKDDYLDWINSLLPRCFKFEDNFNYEPEEIQNILFISKQLNKPPLELAYDWMLEKNCERMIYHAFENFSEYNLDVVRTLLADEDTICGLGDGGAHVGYLCDSSSVTSMLKYLKSDPSNQNLSIEYLINKQTKETAHFFGLNDRGVLLEGMKADVNLIDFDNLDVTYPSIAHDLPAGGKRVIQKSKGYFKTFVSGIEVYNEFGFTENFPGRLIKGNQKS